MIASIERAIAGLTAFATERKLHDEPRLRDAVFQMHWFGECLSMHRCLAKDRDDGVGPCKGHGEEKSRGACRICGGQYGGGLFGPPCPPREQKLHDEIARLKRQIMEMREVELRAREDR